MPCLSPSWRVVVVALVAGFALAGCGPEYPHCERDSHCHEGEYCVNGTCQQCRTDADCPAGNACRDGACSPIEGYCDAAHPCPAGAPCVDNRCQTVTTAETDACATVSCAAGTHCVAGGCVADAPAVCTMESVYFEYDSDALDAEDRAHLDADARCSRELHAANLHLTGHADERGTEEYNLVLSERRAQNVLRYLRSLGVSSELTASGMGEEMATGTDEASMVHDRRVDVHPR